MSYDALKVNSHSKIEQKKNVPSTIIFCRFGYYKNIIMCVYGSVSKSIGAAIGFLKKIVCIPSINHFLCMWNTPTGAVDIHCNGFRETFFFLHWLLLLLAVPNNDAFNFRFSCWLILLHFVTVDEVYAIIMFCFGSVCVNFHECISHQKKVRVPSVRTLVNF